MATSVVSISSEALEVCMTHALSTETEEIMGLLLGDIIDLEVATAGKKPSESGFCTRIWSVSLHRREQAVRSDDRVEISPEQLAAATEEAESLGAKLGVKTRVVGWYHSHPHLAVVPSHVDVGTQAMYQKLESGFIGLIFSVFNSGRVVPGVPTGNQALVQEDGPLLVSMGNVGGVGRVQLTAFQSKYVDKEGQAVPSPPPQVVSNWTKPLKEHQEVLDAAWANVVASSPLQYFQKEVSRFMLKITEAGVLLMINAGGHPRNASKQASRNGHRYLLFAEACTVAAGLSKRISLWGYAWAPSCRGSAIKFRVWAPVILRWHAACHAILVQILREEERLAFFKSVKVTEEETAKQDDSVLHANCHPLLAAHNSAVYQKSLCSLLENCHLPLISSLEGRLKASRLRVEGMKKEKETLLAKLAESKV